MAEDSVFYQYDERMRGHGFRTDDPHDAGGRSQVYSAASLKGKPVPPRQWLVHGLIPSKTVTLFGGDGGTGKSLLAL